MGGEKHNYVSVDKESIGTVYVEDAEFTNSAPIDTSVYQITTPLCNPEASCDYIDGLYGLYNFQSR